MRVPLMVTRRWQMRTTAGNLFSSQFFHLCEDLPESKVLPHSSDGCVSFSIYVRRIVCIVFFLSLNSHIFVYKCVLVFGCIFVHNGVLSLSRQNFLRAKRVGFILFSTIQARRSEQCFVFTYHSSDSDSSDSDSDSSDSDSDSDSDSSSDSDDSDVEEISADYLKSRSAMLKLMNGTPRTNGIPRASFLDAQSSGLELISRPTRNSNSAMCWGGALVARRQREFRELLYSLHSLFVQPCL